MDNRGVLDLELPAFRVAKNKSGESINFTCEVNVRLRILMYGFYWLFVFSAWRSADFLQKLEEKDVVLVMKAKDKKISRTFYFRAGKVHSRSGEVGNSDCRLTWVTAKEGGEVMTQVAKGNPKALTKAVIAGKLLLDGDAQAITWYMGSVSMLGKMYQKKRKSA